ncbi:1-phosphatidylinositol-3-phosphate 5-kinase [Quillaja saponaria]|uniref:1-phosphatidylinositol-3-phosphate 5-kinase n=1 Tax=Quillaja saponaria TaxID=32244 RepID=A0AAD7LAJ9_QUISA|nr:1-phosphatidylinositol-3-phosphate 5-kinase [Quillaja saponaria]
MGKEYSEKVHPSASPEESPQESPEPPSPCFSVESRTSSSLNGELIQSSHLEHYLHSRDYGDYSNAMIDRSMASFSSYPSKVSVHLSPSRSDEDEAEDSGKHLFSASSEYCHDNSDIDSSSVSGRLEFYNYRSLGSSPSDSPSRINFTSGRFGIDVQQGQVAEACWILKTMVRIWYPPPPEDENDDVESNFFPYDDEDDDIGESGALFSSNTSRGGSMDPGDYVKVKCIASGSPSESTLIKGVVCTKNIKHKRMTSLYKNPRLLIIGGALEYQKVPNQLASFDTLLQQENDHLKMIITKIEALRPNVLLVEKSVSSYAQEYLLAKEISLVMNVKRPLLERISRCTGALITPSTDNISTARLGHCELFRLEKLVEEHEIANPLNKKPSKTLMFFEGCPRRLGCTVLLKGTCLEELKKVKHVVQYAVFAAYHLSLEISFLADEGATLPKMALKHSISVPERATADVVGISVIYNSQAPTKCLAEADATAQEEQMVGPELRGSESVPEHIDPGQNIASHTGTMNFRFENALSNMCNDLALNLVAGSGYSDQFNDLVGDRGVPGIGNHLPLDLQEIMAQEGRQHREIPELVNHCVLKGTVCERSRLLRIKFYGCFDKPLGRYLRDDLFDQTSCCKSCKEPADAHVLCYTHQQGNLTINVSRLPSLRLPGERDGKIWMWHRCLRCAHVDGVPPATRRVIMSDAAWGLSFGKFLELSFSNHATANRVATCGHSLQKDCLRYYGFGSMVAFFRYSPIDILSVCLPPSVLEFNGQTQLDWIRKEAAELLSKMETVYREISDVLKCLEQKIISPDIGYELSDTCDLQNHIMELKELLRKERSDYNSLLLSATVENPEPGQMTVDIFELNRRRRSLLIGSRVWDHRLYSLDFLLKKSSNSKTKQWDESYAGLKEPRVDLFAKDGNSNTHCHREQEVLSDEEVAVSKTLSRGLPSQDSNLSERIDSAWTGTDQLPSKVQQLHTYQTDGSQVESVVDHNDDPPFIRLIAPARVHSFDSALRVQERIKKRLTSSLHLSTLRSFHASGDYRNMVRDPVSNIRLKVFACCFPYLAREKKLLLFNDNEPTSIICYALCSKEYEDWVAARLYVHDGSRISHERNKVDASSTFSAWQSFGSLDLDYINYSSYGAEDAAPSMAALHTDPKRSPHFQISFSDESLNAGGKVKFSVTCYCAKQFDSLRKKCCPNEVDFIRSLSRCRRWSAQGGKSNVYFAKSLDERFIIKQVPKTELDSFEEFAPQYFKYLTDSISSGSPTCLAKVLGIYQVTVKNLKGGKETKMDVMLMENLFFKRSISRVYDLKGSARSRYNPDTTGTNKVLLDMNLLESLRTKPIFLGSRAKRTLERASME